MPADRSDQRVSGEYGKQKVRGDYPTARRGGRHIHLLNFDNPELKQILPWTGTSKGPQAFIDAFSRIAKWWTIEDFTVTTLFGEGENVAVFGRFTYRSNSLSKTVTSPFSIHAKVRNGTIM
ncbi:nuclear transport factor 2 family protein [Lacunimicrobium album]